MQKTRCGYLFLTKWVFKHISWWGLGMRRLHRGTQHSIAQLEQKKTFRLGFLHFRARRESKGSLPLNDSAWIHTFGHTYLQYLTDICIHVHNSNYILDCALAQTDQDWRSFLDCQTPTHPEGNDECFRAHGSEQNSMVQVPYAIVTGKYFRTWLALRSYWDGPCLRQLCSAAHH